MKSIFFDLSFLFLLCLFQTTLFGNIDFLGHINPHVYVLFVLMYPPNGNKFRLLFLAFLLGWLMDHFMNSGGLHAFSLTFIAYLRFYILRFVAGKYTISQRHFSIRELSFLKQFSFVFIMVFLHTQVLFLLEFIEVSNLDTKLLNALFSSIFTSFLSLIYLFIVKTPGAR